MDAIARIIHRETIRLTENGYTVYPDKQQIEKLYIKFHGPPGTNYEGGQWTVCVEISQFFPEQPPAVHFTTRIYHPNICYNTGYVCTNALAQNWMTSYGVVTIFDHILPSLLVDPAHEDPLNAEAASLYKEKSEDYKLKTLAFLGEV